MNKILITYSHKFTTYYLTLSQWVSVIALDVKLFVRRILRLLKRICGYLKPVFTVALLGLSFATIITWLGIEIDKYKNWYDGLWDLKAFILTSVFIAAIISVLQGEREHRRNLELQLDLYRTTMWRFEHLINEAFQALTNETLYNTDIFMNVDNLYYFKDNIHCYSSSFKESGKLIDDIKETEFFEYYKINARDYLITTFNEIEKQIDLLRTQPLYVATSYGKDIVNNSDIDQWLEIPMFISYLETSSDLLVSDVLDYIGACASQLYHIIAQLRTPWRYEYDLQIEEKRIEILSDAKSDCQSV